MWRAVAALAPLLSLPAAAPLGLEPGSGANSAASDAGGEQLFQPEAAQQSRHYLVHMQVWGGLHRCRRHLHVDWQPLHVPGTMVLSQAPIIGTPGGSATRHVPLRGTAEAAVMSLQLTAAGAQRQRRAAPVAGQRQTAAQTQPWLTGWPASPNWRRRRKPLASTGRGK